ncbi:CCA tRNA nucleotidyltransferase [Halapricum hydrolyticum]|uniref:CCA-adding enzyme n=1 Tax=Halapricum hydrolyticum TaxID=2979991 RepID=A0AAE3IFR3_9EURY|nr:CCA tRNA nucleotidyltransferase [Halapricum hydrolyticum]MCU4718833.1 CCA tRNA nucleotidyltransferase [Halapricum hydrolyticum]MCU4727759.1 CCA tRNA nucleotidyltransferase [Halapricum hydrolyticum]
MSDEFDAVVSTVRERVEPDREERTRLHAAVDALIERIEAAIEELPVEADVVQVGSTARGTWIAGDRDVDLFVRFPPDLPREKLEDYGLQVGHEVLPDGREEYAEHPYVVGEYDGFDVDLVPCYDVSDASAIQSAVDRTPFHTAYLNERLDADLAGEVRVCKQFLTAIGVYGSDLRTRGFSGYLTELLILEYGGFRPFVEAAADWQPPVAFDPEGHGERETASPSRSGEVGAGDFPFDDPLVVIDPTDPERNVAAVCSAESVARLQHYARELVADPRVELFEPSEPDPVDPDGVTDAFDRRGTTPVAIAFETPALVEDDLYPQLEKSRDGIVGLFDRHGFDVLRSATFADDNRAVVLVELEVAERPAVRRHEGPPVHVREHAENFFQRYDGAAAAGPFLDGDRYVVEREREFRTAAELFDSDAIFEVGLGATVERQLRESYTVSVGPEVATLADRFGTEFARYLDPVP